MFKDGVGRKFVACMFMQATNSLLLYVNCLDSEDFKIMTIGVFGAYVLGNVGQRYVESINKKETPT